MVTPAYNPLAQRAAIIEDLMHKVAREDWHGVADCAMDLRDIEAYVAGLEGKRHP
jgi:hypothetical protein